MKRLRLLMSKTAVASGAAGDFPASNGWYNVEDISLLTIGVKQAGATARTVALTFADRDGNTLFTLSKALAATTAQKLLNLGDVPKVGSADFLTAGDDLAQAMALPAKVRVTLEAAAVITDVFIIGRG